MVKKRYCPNLTSVIAGNYATIFKVIIGPLISEFLEIFKYYCILYSQLLTCVINLTRNTKLSCQKCWLTYIEDIFLKFCDSFSFRVINMPGVVECVYKISDDFDAHGSPQLPNLVHNIKIVPRIQT